jgi:tetratricopeptide (TPR) repeat protein
MKKRYIVYAMLAAAISGCSTESAPNTKIATAPAPAGQQSVSFTKISMVKPVDKKVELSPAQKKALAEFDKKLNEAATTVNRSKFSDADAILKPLLEDKNVSVSDKARAQLVMVNSMNRQGKSAEALVLLDEILAKHIGDFENRTLIGAFNQKIDILRKLERFDDAANTAFELLSKVELTPAEQFRVKRSVIDNFIAAKNYDAAIALNRELIADSAIAANEKPGFFSSIVECYRRAGDLDKAVAANAEAMNFPGSTPDQNANLKLKSPKYRSI